MKRHLPLRGRALLALALLSSLVLGAAAKDITLLNVSYDPTRELYADINPRFADYWQGKTGDHVTVNQSHGGSGKQARAVIDGLEADVVTLALAQDLDAISAKAHLIAPDWQQRLPNNSAPYASTIVFVVRKGNPKGIHDWADLVKPGVQIITPNPKTGGSSRWVFLAGWGYALKKYGSDDAAQDYITKFYKNVPVLDSGARGSTTTFVQRGVGDVLVSWENEAYLILKEFGPDYQIVTPPRSILAEPSVGVVDTFAQKHGTTEVATAYLKFLYTPEAQDLIGKHFYRPRDPVAAQKYASQFPPIELFTVDKVYGGWAQAQKRFFDDGGVFDQIYKPTK